MSLLRLFFAASLFVAAAGGALAETAAVPPGDYSLSVGDVIRIDVHGEDDLTLESQIPATGMINYPFLGQLRVSDVTIAQLQNRITEGLRGDYLIKPEVRVHIVHYRPFFVRGQVRNSGGYPYVPGLTVEKAATIAGGFTDRASLRNIFLIREKANQDQKIKVGLDSPVSPGDTIIVEESLF